MEVDIEKYETVPLFEGLEHKEIAGLLRIAENVIANPGDRVTQQGEPGDGFYVIGAGTFEVVREGDGENKVLAELQELSFFGEMSLVSNAPRSATVVCKKEGRLKKVSSHKFNELLKQNDLTAYKVVLNMSRILAQRLTRLEERFVD